MVVSMKKYLDSIIKVSPVPDNWVSQFTGILDEYMGAPPATFEYNGKTYTPQTFAKEVVKFNEDDYVFLTSFTHHPFYKSFIIEVPDNFSNGAYYNVPLKELTGITETALQKGYTVLWDADVSNRGFASSKGFALLNAPDINLRKDSIDPDMAEPSYTQDSRQKLYEELITQDDHLMHITGIEKTAKGKTFFLVKNSWGKNSSPFGGYVNVSEAYFAVNTITIVVPKAALDKSFQKKYTSNN
jgi:bleomycin hydrolase